MQTQTLSPVLIEALHKIVQYHTPQLDNNDIRALFTSFLMQDAEQGFASCLFDVLPQVNNVFDFIEQATVELSGQKEPLQQTHSSTDYSFQTVIDWIIGLSTPVCIYKHAQHSGSALADLLIVVPKNSNKKFGEYSAVINTVKLQHWNVKYSLYQMQQLSRYIDEGSIYHINACQPEHLLYYDGSEDLPKIMPADFEAIKRKATSHFAMGSNRAHLFLQDAKNYMGKGRMEMAAFMLHQCAEQILKSAVLSICGMDIRNHSILALLQHCSRFAPDLSTIFPGGSSLEDSLTKLLESAYQDARYKDNFVVDTEQINLLYNRISSLLEDTQQSVSKIIAQFPSGQ